MAKRLYNVLIIPQKRRCGKGLCRFLQGSFHLIIKGARLFHKSFKIFFAFFTAIL